MSINETQLKIDIEALQRALGMFLNTAILTIEPDRVQLSIYSDKGWPDVQQNAFGSKAIAEKLDDACEQFYNEGAV